MNVCTNCGSVNVRERIRTVGRVYYVDRVCEDCDYVDVDTEGGT